MACRLSALAGACLGPVFTKLNVRARMGPVSTLVGVEEQPANAKAQAASKRSWFGCMVVIRFLQEAKEKMEVNLKSISIERFLSPNSPKPAMQRQTTNEREWTRITLRKARLWFCSRR